MTGALPCTLVATRRDLPHHAHRLRLGGARLCRNHDGHLLEISEALTAG